GGVGGPGGPVGVGQGCAGADQGWVTQGAELFAQVGVGGDERGFELVEGLGAGFGGGVFDGLEQPDGLDVAVARFGGGRGLAVDAGPGGGDGIDGVVLAVAAACSPVGPVDLNDGCVQTHQVAGQAGAVGAGALDPSGPYRAVGGGPAVQLLIAVGGGRERFS